jgi:hypothetical protein
MYAWFLGYYHYKERRWTMQTTRQYIKNIHNLEFDLILFFFEK